MAGSICRMSDDWIVAAVSIPPLSGNGRRFPYRRYDGDYHAVIAKPLFASQTL